MEKEIEGINKRKTTFSKVPPILALRRRKVGLSPVPYRLEKSLYEKNLEKEGLCIAGKYAKQAQFIVNNYVKKAPGFSSGRKKEFDCVHS